jgi:hypothetical protein
MIRMVSPDGAVCITCCAEIPELHARRKGMKKFLKVNFDRNGPVLFSACKLGFYILTEW